MIQHSVKQGETVSGVARRFGVSRQTVYNHLVREGPFPKPRKSRASKLDRFKSYIDARVREFDVPASVLFRELEQQGYTGGLTILRDYVRGFKKQLVVQLTERFETLPGKQAQVDWGECGTIEVDGEMRKLCVFVFVLGYSRILFARFTTSTRRHVLLDCLKSAFAQYGVPSELLLDNMKQAVDMHLAGQSARFNREFLDFCSHYDVMPLAAPPYWAQVKGKVERGVGYLKHSFLEGRSFTDLDDLNRQLEAWLDNVANVRIHGTTKQRPIDRYEMERPHLVPRQALPVYDTRPVEVRKVPSDSHIRYRSVAYSVHPDAVRQSVEIRADGNRVGDRFEVWYGNRLVAEHTIARKEEIRITLPQHAEEIRRRVKKVCKGERPRSHRPRFRQLAEPPRITEPPHVEIEERSLDDFEALLAEVSV